MASPKKTTRVKTPAPAAKPSAAPARPPASGHEDSSQATTLLAVTGMSPAILTETIWALACDPEEPIIPTRVRVVTTTEGRQGVLKLFSPCPALDNQTPWDALRASLQKAGHDLTGKLQFGETGNDIQIITALDPETHRTRELKDIRSRSDNEAAADFLLDQVRAIVENPDLKLVASIAGGRKTMGALMYACMTLAARETDILTHVLVSEPFETLRDFWFPRQPGNPLQDREKNNHDPAKATVELARVPFVPLRNLFVKDLGRPAGTFSRLVESCRQNIRTSAGEGIRLELDKARHLIAINSRDLELNPHEFMLMLLLAKRAKERAPAIPSYKDAVKPLTELCGELAGSVAGKAGPDWCRADALKSWCSVEKCDDQQIRRVLSELGKKLQRHGRDGQRLDYCLPERGRFSLTVDPALIFIK